MELRIPPQNPSVMGDILGMWIESEDITPSVPAGFQDFGFAADVEKQDAVVAAFKVRKSTT